MLLDMRFWVCSLLIVPAILLTACSQGINPNVPSKERQPIDGSHASSGKKKYKAPASPVAASQDPDGEVQCGKERWSIKTLADPAAKQIDFKDINRTSVAALRKLPIPGGKIGRSAPRQKPDEFKVFQVNADLVSAKQEEDSDIHLVIAEPGNSSETMIVELPADGCTGALQKKQMDSARKSFLRQCGSPGSSRFRDLSGRATIRGVAFFDVIHGQRGVAPNGVEIHPVLSFSGSCSSG